MIVTSEKVLPAILSLQKAAFAEEAEKHNDDSLPPITETLEQTMEAFRSGEVFFVHEIGGAAAGTVRGSLHGDECHVARLAVHPVHRRKGVAEALMTELEEYFRGACSCFRLFTGEKSSGALALYGKMGYLVTGYEAAVGYRLVHMKKQARQTHR